MKKNINKIQLGDKVAIISPSDSLGKISAIKNLASERLQKEFGVEVVFSKNCLELDLLGSSSMKSRVDDLHDAFADKSIKAILCATGGYNSNDLLPYIDWKIIKNNPKPFIGASDITVLLNAIHAKTGITTYYGPNFYKFGMKLGLEYTLQYFKKGIFSSEAYSISPSEQWTEDRWFRNQDERVFNTNNGFRVCNPGFGIGKIIGGNLCSLNLLQGTKYMPSLKNTILCIEEDDTTGESTSGEFFRNLHSILQQPGAKYIKGILIGRFLSNSKMTMDKIDYFIKSTSILKNIPIIANIDFGHTDPTITLPIGGIMEINAQPDNVKININKN